LDAALSVFATVTNKPVGLTHTDCKFGGCGVGVCNVMTVQFIPSFEYAAPRPTATNRPTALTVTENHTLMLGSVGKDIVCQVTPPLSEYIPEFNAPTATNLPVVGLQATEN
jgi:hypothetical protein